MKNRLDLTLEMPKSRATIQKDYRASQKEKKGDEYMEKERERKRKAYVPVSQLQGNDLKKRRLEQRLRVQKHRAEKKRQIAEAGANSSKAIEKNRQTRSTSSPSSRLIVKFDFTSRRKEGTATRKRVSRALSKAHRKITNLESDNKKLKAKTWRLEKKLQRSKASSRREKSNNQLSSQAAITPKSKTRKELRDLGLSPRSVPREIKKKLLFANALIQDVKESTSKNKSRKKAAPSVLAGSKILKRYRLLRQLKEETGLSKRSLQLKPKVANTKARLAKIEMKNKVVSFLSRDDNSRMMPGKADYKKHEGEKIQKRYLNDYLGNLYEKFKAENPNIKMSRSRFCNMRPNFILTTSYTSRNTCLCQRHQNMALKLRWLKSLGVKVHTSPDAFMKNVQQDSIDDLLTQCTTEKVKYSQWKRVEVEGKKKMKVVDVEVPRQEFCNIFKEEMKNFREHAERVKVHYHQIKELKQNLPEGHMIVQMDFAENYACQSVEEVQSAYWNSTQVTLHPAVFYYKNNNNDLCHKSTVVVSDELGHNSATVYAIIRKLIPEMKAILPSLKYVHYVTDSPTSQYRNKKIFHILVKHRSEFGVNASWHYFEAGHGKGPCDGVGGTTKRMADEAVKQHKATIQDANDFFQWAKAQTSSTIQYLFVSKEECLTTEECIEGFGQLRPVPGALKLHAAVPLDEVEGTIAVRKTSCFCANCFAGGKFNLESTCGWQKSRTKSIEIEGINFLTYNTLEMKI